MPADLIYFFISVLIAFVSWSLVAKWYIWPKLRSLPFVDAVRPILLFNTFRYVGFGFIIPGVVAMSGLPRGFGIPGAYGDIIASALAFISLSLLGRSELGARIMIWLFNIQGTIDILSAMVLGPHFGIDPASFGAMYFILTIYVPAVLVGHLVIFRLLFRKGRDLRSVSA